MENTKKLPIGIQEFEELRKGDYLYIDKTEYIYGLIESGKYYFLSRPRRFGKSLLINTFKELFQVNRDLFKGLWIYDKIDWAEHPVIRIDFSKIDYKIAGLYDALVSELDKIATEQEVALQTKTLKERFIEIITVLSKKNKVVVLIDEYDKPIIDYVDNLEKAKENRDTLKYFYSCLKSMDSYLEFLFITGVSKFSQISIFSDLNHLNDITSDEKYCSLLGYTPNEMERYFDGYKKELSEKYSLSTDKTNALIKEWYNGYSWNGRQFVYNPFSILNLFSKNEFDDYWFKTATPTFLLKMLNQADCAPTELVDVKVDTTIFNKWDIENMDVYSLLFQTGYLTLKEYEPLRGRGLLSYPNKEVEKSFSAHLLAEFNKGKVTASQSLILRICDAVEANNIEEFIALLKILFANVTYPNIDNKEKYYHSILYLCLKLIGFHIESEVMTNRGRIDAVIKTDDTIYIIEFKIGKAETAIAQIKEKGYFEKHLGDNKQIVLLGIGFDPETKNIGDYIEESL